MKVSVQFFSYFKDLAQCARTSVEIRDGATIRDLMSVLYQRFPELEKMKKSTLIAVDMEYQSHDFQLIESNEVTLFPPVQGGQ